MYTFANIQLQLKKYNGIPAYIGISTHTDFIYLTPRKSIVNVIQNFFLYLESHYDKGFTFVSLSNRFHPLSQIFFLCTAVASFKYYPIPNWK